MGYLAVWKVLEEMVADFRRKGAPIPSNIFNDLKYARTLINVLRADPSRLETNEKIEEYLNNVESFLVFEGQKFGEKYIAEWLGRLEEARKVFDEEESALKFIPGLPREQKWVRVKISEEMPMDVLKDLARELNLSFKLQDDGFLLVCGEDERVKYFVKKAATRYGLKAGK